MVGIHSALHETGRNHPRGLHVHFDSHQPFQVTDVPEQASQKTPLWRGTVLGGIEAGAELPLRVAQTALGSLLFAVTAPLDKMSHHYHRHLHRIRVFAGHQARNGIEQAGRRALAIVTLGASDLAFRVHEELMLLPREERAAIRRYHNSIPMGH